MNDLRLSSKTAATRSLPTLPNDVARRNGFPAPLTFRPIPLNLNRQLGPEGGGIGGGGAPPGTLAYGTLRKKAGAMDTEGFNTDPDEALRLEERRQREDRDGRLRRGRDFSGGDDDEKRQRMARRRYERGETTGGGFSDVGFASDGKSAMPFLEQNRPEKVKEIYRALVREHPEMGAEMKARIAIRKGRKTKQARKSPAHGGPPYKAPLSRPGAGGAHFAKAAAAFRDEGVKLAFRETARDVLTGAASGAVLGALKGAHGAKKKRWRAALRGAAEGAAWGGIGGVVKRMVGATVGKAFDKRAELSDELRRRVRSWDDGGACLSGETLRGGKGDGKPDAAFPAAALRAGMRVEREHLADPRARKEIAKDHLTEDPRYYEKLRRMEKSAACRYTVEQLKAAAKPLTPEERATVMARGAVWHHGPRGEATPAIRKAVVNGETVYWCATHRAWDFAPTLAGALRKFRFIKTTA